MDKIETEQVKIEEWVSRLPSEICTNKGVFDQVFSINTWNNVLGPEQRERLKAMLPKEVTSSPDLLAETIQEFFNGKLTSFAQSPLETFFQKLESGQYDPVVVEVKKNIKKELRKESIRQLKNYHTKLLEEIIVSRHRHLAKFEAKLGNGKGRGKWVNNNSNNKGKRQQQGGVLQSVSPEMNANKIVVKNNGSSCKKEQQNLTALKVVLVKSEETNGNHVVGVGGRPIRKRKGKEDLGDGQCIPPKRSTKGKGRQTVSATALPLVDNNNSNVDAEVNNGGSNAILDEKTGLMTTLNSQQPFGSVNEGSILSAALTCDKPLLKPSLEGISTTGGIYSTSSSPTKDSPILASQLQGSSPQISVKLEEGVGLFSTEPESNNGCITLNYQKLDDKPSDIEKGCTFQEINPSSIAYNSTSVSNHSVLFNSSSSSTTMPNVVLTSGNTPHQQAINCTSSTTTSTSGTTTAVLGNRLVQVQHSISPQGGGKLITVTVPSSSGSTLSNASPVYVLSTKTLSAASAGSHQPQQGRIIQISKDNMKAIPISSNQQLAFINSPTRLVLKGSHQQQGQQLIRISNTDLMKAKTFGGGVHYLTSSGKSVILHPVSTSSSSSLGQSSGLKISNVGAKAADDSSGGIMAFGNTQDSHSYSSGQRHLQFKSSNTISLNSALLECGDDLNLSLGNAVGGSIINANNTTGGNLEGMMMASDHHMDTIDKIEDLSVLDGNPFDSIPNLSDELDGIDLDLVDGLCDFEGLLSEEKKYPSFFSLIRDVLCSTRDHRMNFTCLEKTIRKWSATPAAQLNAWFLKISDWNSALMTALNFLTGTYQDLHPEDFVPYIEYKYKTKYYQWIGAGRDSDNNLTPLSAVWMDHMDQLPPIKKLDGDAEDQEEEDEDNEDSEAIGEDARKKNKRPITPPPPRVTTEWTVKPSSEEEKSTFRQQERQRFENPHKACTYILHGYESVVGPVKGVYSSQVGMSNKARGHTLLVDDRPPYVTILALVRDAVARLPNGEGTRSEICEMLRDSQFLNPDASSATLNSVVSGALDRLHYERDPCVRYDSHKKSWIYLHRDRTQEQFERLHHNRSYTKSTKSRNNTSRKIRKPIGKGVSGSTSSELLSPASTILSSSTDAEVGTSLALSDEPRLALHSETSIPAFHAITTTTAHPQVVQIGSPNSDVVTSQGNEMVNQVALPMGTAARAGGGVSGSVSKLAQPFQAGDHLTPSPQQTVLELQPRLSNIQKIQVSPATIMTSSNQSILSATTGANNNGQPSQITQSQMMLGPQAVLRIANALRLSGIRLPVPGPGGPRGGAQHRIVLTRGPAPGPGQAQGILLGQTATGQTVILSTSTSSGIAGGLHSTSTGQGPATTTATIQLHGPTPTLTSVGVKGGLGGTSSGNFMSLLRPAIVTSRVGVAGTAAVSAPSVIPRVPNEPKSQRIMAHRSIVGGTQQVVRPGNTGQSIPSSQVPTLVGTVNVTSHQQQSDGHQAGQTIIGVPAQTIRQPLGLTLATMRGGTMSVQQPGTRPIATSTVQLHTMSPTTSLGHAIIGQGQQLTTSCPESVNNPNAPLCSTSTPIIIRSVQGDLMLPGQLALGKGGGFKLIPLPVGSKTMFAKIMTPNTPTTTASPGQPRFPITLQVTPSTTDAPSSIPITIASASSLSLGEDVVKVKSEPAETQ